MLWKFKLLFVSANDRWPKKHDAVTRALLKGDNIFLVLNVNFLRISTYGGIFRDPSVFIHRSARVLSALIIDRNVTEVAVAPVRANVDDTVLTRV